MSIREYGLVTRLIRTRPLLVASCVYLSGCIVGYRFICNVYVLWAAFAILLLAAGVFAKSFRRLSAVFLLLAMLPVGAARFENAWNDVRQYPEQKNALLCGRIASVPENREEQERTVCVLQEISVDGCAIPGRLRLYLRGDSALRSAVSLGQTIECTAHIWQADTATNPGQFDFSNYLRVNGLSGYATAEIENAVLCAPEYSFGNLPERFREAAGRWIDTLFPRNAAIARAFLIGDRSGISEENRKSYENAGAAHILALSGMHISIIAFLLNALLIRLIGRNPAFFLTCLLLTVYGWLIGFHAAFVRALLMFAYGGFAPVFGRRADAATGLSFSMLFWLLIRPLDILSASFMLSYSAVAGIIFLVPPISELFRVRTERRMQKGAPIRHLCRWAVNAMLMTAAAQIAVLPAIVYFFGAQPLFSLLLNLIAVPTAMIAYVLAIPAALLRLSLLCRISDCLFGLLTQIVRVVASIPFASVRIARFPAWLMLFCGCACFLSSGLTAIRMEVRRFLPLTVILAVLVSNLLAFAASLGTSVVFLDAGEADCAVVRSSGKVYMIDAGDDYSPAADYLSAMNYVPEAVFLTHPHADHIIGLNGVLDFCTPKRIYIPSNWDAYALSESAAALMDRIASAGCEVVEISAGDVIQVDAKTYFSVLAPQEGFSANSANEDSLILELKHCDTSVLFLADSAADDLDFPLPDVDLIKVGHHGAEHTLSADLLESVSPSACVISVGTNDYGHPSADTLELIRTAGSALLRTDISGAITCSLSEDGTVRVKTYH